jgi:multidrug efflux pump
VVDIEKLITKPIEKELNTITGVDEIKSTSVPNFSSIHIKFTYDITPTEALRKVKDAVDKARGDANFPTDLPAEPNVFEMNFSELMPVMNINLSGDYPWSSCTSMPSTWRTASRTSPRSTRWRSAACPSVK